MMKYKIVLKPFLVVLGIVSVVGLITFLIILAYKYYIVFAIIGGSLLLVIGLVYAFIFWLSRLMKDDKHYTHR